MEKLLNYNLEGIAMKKIFNNIMAASLLVAGVAFTACSNNDNDITTEQAEKPTVYKLTVSAQMDDNDGTRGVLALDGNKLNAMWEKNDIVNVYRESTGYNIGDLTAQNDGVVTTFTGEIGTYLNVGETLILKYKAGVDYRDQRGGTLKSIAENFDAATATIKIKEMRPAGPYSYLIVPESTAIFESQQAIVKCNLNMNIPYDYDKHFCVYFNGYQVNVYNYNGSAEEGYPMEPKSEFYVAIPLDEKSVTSNLTFEYDGKSFVKNVTLKKGKYHHINVTLE